MQTPDITAKSIRLKWWPSPQDFNEAVQTPGTTYSDADLRLGQVELTALGLPRPQSGNFASVYRVDRVEKQWAVRCFLRDIPDQQERYRHIERTLQELNLPCFVSFDYIAEGVRIRGDWFPILKMEWAEGPTLTEYIQENLHEPDKLRALAEQVKEHQNTLLSHGIAHGDLQHGNMIVTDHGLRLVDYDGVYVPSLTGQPSNELGHPNYQHPARKASDFHAQLDNFSAWVIYSSLICLAEDPALFEQLNVGDDCLLFRQRDFIQPTRSRAFSLLERHPNAEIKKHARWIRGLLLLPIDRVPNLSAVVVEPTGLSELEASGRSVPGAGSQTRMASTTWAMILVVLLAIAALASWSVSTAKRDTQAIDNAVTKISMASLPEKDRARIVEANEYVRKGRDASDTDTQITYYAKALAIYEDYPASQTEQIIDCSHDLGHAYLSAGNPTEALHYFEQARSDLRRMGPVDKSNGSLYYRLGVDIVKSTPPQ